MNTCTKLAAPAALAALLMLTGCAATVHTAVANGLAVTVTRAGETRAIIDDTVYGRFMEGDRLCWLDVEVENVSKVSVRLLSGGVVSDRGGPTSVILSRAHEVADRDAPGWYHAVEQLDGRFLPAGDTLAFGELVTCDLDARAGGAVEINGDGGALIVRVPIEVE